MTLSTILQTSKVKIAQHACTGTPLRSAKEQTRWPELVIVQEGAFAREDQKSKLFMDESSAAYFASGDVYQIRHFASRPDRSTIISFFDAQLLTSLFPTDLMPGRPVQIRLDAKAHLLHEKLLYRAQHSNELNDVITALQKLLNHLTETARDKSYSRVDIPKNDWRFSDEILFTVLDFIYRHRGSSLTVSQIAKHAGYSRYHLSRLFKVRMGYSVRDYIKQLRLAVAIRRIVHETTSLTKIAIDTGFSSSSHLSATIKNMLHTTPSEIRRTLHLAP